MKFCISCMEPYEDSDICPKCGYSESSMVKDSLYLPIGCVIAERYLIGKVIGSGSYGATYIGWDKTNKCKVAIKEYLPGEFATRVPGVTALTMFTDSKKQKQFHDGLVKFLDDAEKLSHIPKDSAIAPVLDYFSSNNTVYLVSELYEGETLAQKLEQTKKIPAKEAIEMILPIINSLKLVHKQGLIHGNICPDNIFISNDGKVKLIDFSSYKSATASHSRSLSAVVNPGYSAEEQYRSRSDQGPYTDIYSIGAVLYRMITGKAPPDAFERRISIERDKRDIIKQFTSGVSHIQATAIMNALNIRIEDRTPDADEFAQELTSTKALIRRGNKLRVIDNGKLKKGIITSFILGIGCVILLIVMFALGVIDLGDGGFGANSLPEGMARVPSVVSQDITKARELLTNADLQIKIVDKQFSNDIPADYILYQNIKAGSVVDAKSVVSLTVSGGQEMKLVPLVEGDTIDDARTKLESVGFTVETEASPSLYKSEGIVFSQDIKANTEYAVGNTIVLKVSNGEVIKGVAYLETVPDLTGLTLSGATEKLMSLASAGKNDGKPFGINENVSKDYSKTIPAGCIISQNLEAGTQEMTDKTFSFVISLGIHYVMLPDIQYQTLDSAKEKLKLDGESQFQLNIKEMTDENVAKGHVVSQNPAGGTKVEYDSPVSIVISLGPKEFPLLNTVKKAKDTAEAELKESGITNIVYNEVRDDNIPVGSIVSQSPKAGTTVTSKTKVELDVSIGKILRTVPNVVNRSSSDAEAKIKNAKLTVSIYEDYSNTVIKGNVISQYPTSGELETGSEVVITVSKGRKPVNVPYVIGINASSAEKELVKLNLNVQYGEDEYDEDITSGMVKSQNPKSGSTGVYEQDTVTLVISKGPKPVVIPNVIDFSEDDAISTLINKRFNVYVVYEEDANTNIGRVTRVQPTVGTSAPRDSDVTITVSLGIRIPDLGGLSEYDAKNTLSLLNLRSYVRYIESTSVPKGLVVLQSPTSNDYVNKKSTVDLYVSSGTSVPYVIGTNSLSAINALYEAGLNAIIKDKETAAVPMGEVISQSTSSGTKLSAGDTVTLTVSIGVPVPNVIGMTKSSASKALSDKGLMLSVSQQESAVVPKGAVISQLPEAGTYINGGSTVAVIISSGTSVPNVVGLSKYDAIDIFTNMGLQVNVTEQDSSSVNIGYVMSQSPVAGQEINGGDTVTIIVSSGVTIPNVVGKPQNNAENILLSANLQVNVINQESDTVSKGKVISQYPESGNKVNGGDIVTIIVSGGASVPNVVGMTQSDAEVLLSNAGLFYSVAEQESSYINKGIVISQSPGPETAVSEAGIINLLVSSGVKVPDLIGMSQSDAETALLNAGLQWISSEEASTTVSQGYVISQSQDAGTHVNPGDIITISVSTGSGEG